MCAVTYLLCRGCNGEMADQAFSFLHVAVCRGGCGGETVLMKVCVYL